MKRKIENFETKVNKVIKRSLHKKNGDIDAIKFTLYTIFLVLFSPIIFLYDIITGILGWLIILEDEEVSEEKS